MDRIINSNKDTQTIYEIYRGCRLCGAGAGYKMPIIQSVVDSDGNDVELKQKIVECLQIEVHQDDKMPPLICELCVDKVNEFYEFLEMCRQTNKRTRQRLGLPVQAVTKSTAMESSDCILGVTEPVYVPDDEDEPLTKTRSSKPKTVKPVTQKKVNVKIKEEPDVMVKIKKEPELRVKLEKNVSRDSLMPRKDTPRPSRHCKAQPSSPTPPVRTTRSSGNDDNVSLSSLKEHVKLEKLSNSSKSSPVSKSSPSPKSSSALKSSLSSKSSSGSKESLKSEPTSKSKPGPASKTGPASKKLAWKSEPPSKTGSKPGPASKTGSTSKLGPASKLGPSSKTGPASKTDTPSKSGPTSKTASKPGPASKTPLSSKSSQILKSIKSSPGPRVLLKRDVKMEEETSPTSRGKRLRDKDPEKSDVPVKKVKISLEKSPAPKSKSRRSPSPLAAPSYTCAVCDVQSKNLQGHLSHMRSHLPSFTNPKLACNACEEWFSTADDTAAHHREHRNNQKPYYCRKCFTDFKQMQAYDSHFEKDECLPDDEVPDKKCDECWLTFPTEHLLDEHKCLGEDGRPGGKCYKCSRSYATLKNLRKHESSCTAKKKASGGSSEVKIDPAIKAQLLPYYVRMARCDSLLIRGKKSHYDVSEVPSDFGLDKDCIYPYRFYRSWFRSDFGITGFDSMVSIKDDVKNEFCNRDFVHWDSEDSGESDNETVDSDPKKSQTESLVALSLKTIFSPRFVGKVPRKRRKVKVEKVFDNTDFDTDITKDIHNIIDNLNVDTNDSFKSDSIMNNTDSMGEEKSFDYLLKDNESENKDSSKTNVEVDDTHADVNNKTDEPMDTSESENTAVDTEKNNLVNSCKDTLGNKDSNSTEQNNVSENRSQNNDIKVNGETKQINEDIDDKRLLDALDAQIGENDNLNEKFDGNNDNINQNDDVIQNNGDKKEEKISLDDLIPKDKNTKSMDLDNVSDEEFNLEV